MKSTKEFFDQCFFYNMVTGHLIWRARPRDHYKSDKSQKICTTKFAGKIAGNVDKLSGYIQIYIDGKNYYAHRIIWCIMLGEMPEKIDHKNHIRSDNRFINLRNTDCVGNGRNHSISKNNTSGVTGVCWDKIKKRWLVSIRTDYIHRFIGYFDTLEEAAIARYNASRRMGFHPNHGSSALHDASVTE